MQKKIKLTGPDVEPFIHSVRRNQWLNAEGMNVFVRMSIRSINGEKMKLFDVANIEIEEKLRGKGRFKRWLTHVETAVNINPHLLQGVYVENLGNSRLAGYLAERGYLLQKPCAGFPTMYKILHP